MSDEMITPAYIHDDYERISDDLMWLGYNSINKCSYILRFNVTLANVTKDGRRIPFHTEYRYETRKYTNVFAGNSIRRHITYYMSIESSKYDEFGNKDFLMIRPCDIIYIRRQFDIIEKWFTSENSVYTFKDNKLTILGRPQVSIEGLAQNKYIIISPIVMEDKGTFVPGIRVVLDNSNTFDMSMNSFYELYYIISSIDMYNAASTLMAYFGRPPFGTNMWSPNDMNKIYESNEPDIQELEGSKKRTLGKKFFD